MRLDSRKALDSHRPGPRGTGDRLQPEVTADFDSDVNAFGRQGRRHWFCAGSAGNLEGRGPGSHRVEGRRQRPCPGDRRATGQAGLALAKF